jgi:GDP-L-fucose synthase
MNIMICGRTGFMGMNIFNSLLCNEKYSVCPSNFSTGNFRSIDLTNKGQIDLMLTQYKPDIIIQAAASTSGVKDILSRPYIHVTDNAIMNSLLLRACYEYNVKHFIFLSCGVMYQPGDTPRKETDYNESDKIFPAYFGVGWTKVYIEKMCEFYSRLGRTKHTVIRHSNTIGPFDKYGKEESHMFAATIDKVMRAKDGDEIEVWGSGEETARDLLYVSDVCDFIKLIIEKQTDPYKLYNVGAGRSYTVKEIVEKVVETSGKNLKIRYNTERPVISTKLALDSTKAKMELGWEPKVSLEEGILKTMTWYKEAFLKDEK